MLGCGFAGLVRLLQHLVCWRVLVSRAGFNGPGWYATVNVAVPRASSAVLSQIRHRPHHALALLAAVLLRCLLCMCFSARLPDYVLCAALTGMLSSRTRTFCHGVSIALAPIPLHLPWPP